jgi:TonB family protein
MKKEFPFGWALLFALVVHALVGIFLKQNPLLIAAPVPLSNASGPVKMHFVESPPQAKSLPANADAKYLSDATRKAGPVVKTEKREQKSMQYAQKAPGPKQARPLAKSGRSNPGGEPEREMGSLPSIERPALEQTPGPGDYRIPPSGRDEKKLADSLQNLDQFIGKGEESGRQGSGSPGDGDLPSGDPGSGVFFDTQGFDLGPWANRVVAIVRSNWIVPVAAELGVKGVVSVAFKVERSGRIIDIRVISPSGTPSFDQAAMNALKTSSPFPALPADFPRPVLPGVFRFYYNVPVPSQ